MKHFKLLVAALTLLPGLALAQSMSLPEYLNLRKENSVNRETTGDELQAFVGAKSLEVSGVVRGFMETDKGQMVILDLTDGTELYVSGKSLPTWIRVSLTPARVLFKASRPDANGLITAEYVAAIAEGTIADYENAHAPKGKKPVQKGARTGGSKSSRGGPRPGTPGNGTPSISGRIGSGRTEASRVTSKEYAEILPAYSEFASRVNPRLSQEQADQIADSVIRHSVRYGLDARLVMAVIQVESDFNPQCTSSAGAMGLGQLMHANCLEHGVNNPYDIDDNIYGTCIQLREHFDRYSEKDDTTRLILTLAAYNAGPGAVKKYGGVPPYKETQNYIRKVTEKYRQLCG